MNDVISKRDTIFAELKESLLQELTQKNIFADIDIAAINVPDFFTKRWWYQNYPAPTGTNDSLSFVNSLSLGPGEISAIARNDGLVGLFYYASLLDIVNAQP